MRDFNEDYSGATSDAHLVELWLSGRPKTTERLYRYGVGKFFDHLSDKSLGLRDATVADVVDFAKSLSNAPSTNAKTVATVKSLLSYAHKTGYTVFNVGKVIRCPRIPDKLHERILDEASIGQLIEAAGEGRYAKRNLVLVRFFYSSGARVSEVAALSFKDIDGRRVTVHGKGNKTRTVFVSQAVADELLSLRLPDDTDESPVFKSYRGIRISGRGLREVVYKVAERASQKASPHWFRHAHASHALDNGAPIHLVQKGLGHANVSTTSRYLHVKPNTGASDYLNT